MRDELLKLHRADFGPAEEQAVLNALRSGWLTKGPRTREFEQAFALRIGAPCCLGVNSCTAALHLALLAGGVGAGDEVIVPALTFAASANVVVHCGATPIFADVLPATHCIDPEHVAALISPHTKALVAVHFAGVPCALDELRELADRCGLFIVEDCAHAVETEYKGRTVGVAGGSRFAAYSFYATKNLICGEGGMLACFNADDHQRAMVLGLHGMSADAWKRYSGEGFRLYDIVEAGYKYNMFDLQAALGLVQLSKLDANWQRRHARMQQYAALIAQAFPQGEVTLQACPPDCKSAHHLCVVRLDLGGAGFQPAGSGAGPGAAKIGGTEAAATRMAGTAARPTGESAGKMPAPPEIAGKMPAPPAMPHASPVRDSVIHGLRRRNVEAYVHYICLTETEFYRERYGTLGEQTPTALDLSRRSITLPLFPSMTEADVEYAIAMLQESVDEALG